MKTLMTQTLVMIDLETGGLNPQENGVTEIAAVAFCLEAGKAREIETYSTLVKPFRTHSYTSYALSLQGQTLETLERDGANPLTAYQGLAAFLERHVGKPGGERAGLIWAHNAPFDHSFLCAFSRDVSYRDDFSERCDWSCTKSLFYALRALGFHDGKWSNLKELCRLFCVTPNGAEHTALRDARAAVGCLAAMTETFTKGLL